MGGWGLGSGRQCQEQFLCHSIWYNNNYTQELEKHDSGVDSMAIDPLICRHSQNVSNTKHDDSRNIVKTQTMMTLSEYNWHTNYDDSQNVTGM